MTNADPAPLTPAEKAELEALAALPDADIDTSDIPPQTDWTAAVRGAFFRAIEKPVSLRVDADILDWFQGQGAGYQTRINAVLREYMERQRNSRA